MIIYFVVPDFGPAKLQWMVETGVENILISYHHIRGKDINRLPFKNVFLDSGAYTAFNSGKPINLEEYTDWLRRYLPKHDNISTYACLDDINDWRQSVENQAYMERAGLKPIPCYHYGEPEEVLINYCSRHEYVALGGLVTKEVNTEIKRRYWASIYQRYPNNRFHLYGVASPNIFYQYQPYSLDSNSWTKASGFGAIAGFLNDRPVLYGALKSNLTGFQHFFTRDEMDTQNMRAMLEWQKLEWAAVVDDNEPDQGRLLL